MSEPNDVHPIATPAIRLTFGRHVINYFFTGLIIAGPVGITLYIAWWIIGVVDHLVTPFVPKSFNPSTYLPFEIPGFGLIVALLTITIVGFLAANLVGRTLVQLSERILSRVPMVSTLYKAIKQLFETVLAQSGDSFRQVGLIQYPCQGLWSLVFISTEAKGEIAAKIAGNAIMSCFLPTTLNPTLGFLLFVPQSDIVLLDMSPQDAAKLVISAGLVSPEYQKKTAALAEAALGAKAVETTE